MRIDLKRCTRKRQAAQALRLAGLTSDHLAHHVMLRELKARRECEDKERCEADQRERDFKVQQRILPYFASLVRGAFMGVLGNVFGYRDADKHTLALDFFIRFEANGRFEANSQFEASGGRVYTPWALRKLNRRGIVLPYTIARGIAGSLPRGRRIRPRNFGITARMILDRMFLSPGLEAPTLSTNGRRIFYELPADWRLDESDLREIEVTRIIPWSWRAGFARQALLSLTGLLEVDEPWFRPEPREDLKPWGDLLKWNHARQDGSFSRDGTFVFTGCDKSLIGEPKFGLRTIWRAAHRRSCPRVYEHGRRAAADRPSYPLTSAIPVRPATCGADSFPNTYQATFFVVAVA